jgi:arabinogalactan endo-1,4-beta-galactosidase
MAMLRIADSACADDYAIGADLSFLIVLETPGNRGKGVFWWEPAVPAWRNGRGMFDDEENAMPVITVFDRFARK